MNSVQAYAEEIPLDEVENRVRKRIELCGFEENFRIMRNEIPVRYFEYMCDKMLEYGVCCFVDASSTESDATEKLMWSLYANGVTGIRVEFDLDELQKSLDIESINTTFDDRAPVLAHGEIDYVNERPKISSFKFFSCLGETVGEGWQALTFQNFILDPYLFTKSADWSREKEYRIVVEGAASKLVGFDLTSIKKITFGSRCDTELRKMLADIFSGRAELYDIALCPQSYKLQENSISF